MAKKKQTRKKKKKKMKIEIETEAATKQVVKRTRKSSNYIDNEKMYQEMVQYVDQVQAHQKAIKKLNPEDPLPPKPKVSEYIGSCILMIANRLATKPNFANYVHRDEMVGDGIENCLMYIDNFDPNKSKNPFAYFTQIIYFAFVRRIQKEKKQMYVKMKMLEKLDDKGNVRRLLKDNIVGDSKNPYAEYFNLKDNDVTFFEKREAKMHRRKKSKKSKLDEFFDV